jgi:hypothetical protein
MKGDIDPEVLHDAYLRAVSERDTARGRDLPEWSPPKIHSQVPCRGRCGSLVDWTEDAEDRLQMFNRELVRRNDAPLDQTKIAFCGACREAGTTAAAQRNRKLVDAMAEAIKELKDGCESHREYELLDKLKRAGHPDVDGLTQWLTDKNNKGSKRIGKGSL